MIYFIKLNHAATDCNIYETPVDLLRNNRP